MTNPEDRLVFNDKSELIEYITRQINHAAAWNYTAERLDDAHKYCQKYLLTSSWGKNVWHSILEDAIRMKKLYEPGREP